MPVAEMSEIKTEITEPVIPVKVEPNDGIDLIAIACDPWSVKAEPSLLAHESWPKLQVQVWVELARQESSPNQNKWIYQQCAAESRQMDFIWNSGGHFPLHQMPQNLWREVFAGVSLQNCSFGNSIPLPNLWLQDSLQKDFQKTFDGAHCQSWLSSLSQTHFTPLDGESYAAAFRRLC